MEIYIYLGKCYFGDLRLQVEYFLLFLNIWNCRKAQKSNQSDLGENNNGFLRAHILWKEYSEKKNIFSEF